MLSHPPALPGKLLDDGESARGVVDTIAKHTFHGELSDSLDAFIGNLSEEFQGFIGEHGVSEHGGFGVRAGLLRTALQSASPEHAPEFCPSTSPSAPTLLLP